MDLGYNVNEVISMRLNGKGCQSKTILNGKPLYGYDAAKQTRRIKHFYNHKQTVEKQREQVKSGRIATKKETKSVLVFLAVDAFIILCLIILFMNFRV